ncbi:MAG: hypothetical protein V2B18_03525 [Pseudomonadota bacterium]
MTESMLIYCADIGSVKNGRFGWARLGRPGGDLVVTGGDDIGALVTSTARDLNAGFSVALGFECPLYVPISEDPNGLTSARTGEGSRCWCAGAGAGALATGLTEAVWILRHIRAELEYGIPAFLDWTAFQNCRQGFFLWEAFVTGQAKGGSHQHDAEIAVRAFASALPDIPSANAVKADDVHSLIGAALLRTGWSSDLTLLSKACVVIRG